MGPALSTEEKMSREFSYCPVCGKPTLIRCKHCRETYNKYKCKDCEFEGP